MNNETQRAINIVKDAARDMDITMALDVVLPIIQRLVDVTEEARKQEKMIGWRVDELKVQTKQILVDLDALKEEKKRLQETINQERVSAMEEVANIKEEAKTIRADAIKKKREATVRMEEVEKTEFLIKHPVTV